MYMLFLFPKNVVHDFDLEKTIVLAGKDFAWYFLLIGLFYNNP